MSLELDDHVEYEPTSQEYSDMWGVSHIVIPIETVANPKLSSNDKLLFGFLLTLRVWPEGSDASDRYLSNLIRDKSFFIRRSLQRLEEQGYINIKYKEKNGKNKRFITIDESYKKRHHKTMCEFMAKYYR